MRDSPRPEEETLVWAGDEPDYDLKAEPRIANALHKEECFMGVGLGFVKSPGGSVERRSNSDVPNDRHPHIRMGLKTE